MEPKEETKFRSGRVERIIKDHLEINLNDTKYDPNKSSEMTQRLCNAIKREVLNLGFERYRILVYAYVGEKNDQSLQVASKFLWDEKRDCYATASHSTSSMFATATVYAVYFD